MAYMVVLRDEDVSLPLRAFKGMMKGGLNLSCRFGGSLAELKVIPGIRQHPAVICRDPSGSEYSRYGGIQEVMRR
jgi:hypothetical protein